MEQFPGNSKEKPAPPDPDDVESKKVITGKVIRRKQPLGKRFWATFIGGQAKEVWEYVVFDILVPSVKDMVIDSFSSGIERMLRPEGRSHRSVLNRSLSRPGYVSYNNYSRPSTKPPFRAGEDRPYSGRPRVNYEFKDVILETRTEAETVLADMYHIAEKYEVVTVMNLYEMLGIRGSNIDEKWGWTDLRGTGATRLLDGTYLVDLPPPIPLD